MNPAIDIRRAAWLMVRRCGEDTEVQTSVRADEMLGKVDVVDAGGLAT